MSYPHSGKAVPLQLSPSESTLKDAFKPGVVAHAFNPSTAIQRNPVSKNQKKKKKKKKKKERCIQKCVSMVILNPFRLTD
jgi:hypothetical protein